MSTGVDATTAAVPVAAEPHASDALVLFAEARRRRRIRRLIAGAVAIVVVTGFVGIDFGAGGPGSGAVDRAFGGFPYGSSNSRSRTTPSGPVWLKHGATASPLAVESPNSALLTFTGSLTHGATRQATWIDRTFDGGQTWTALPAGFHKFADISATPFSPNELISVGPSTVVSVGYRDGLWVSYNAGTTWHHRLGDARVRSVSEADGTVWIAAGNRLLTSTAAMTSFAPTPSPPPDASIEGGTVVPVSSSTVAIELKDRHDSAAELQVTDDGGATWTSHQLPCQATDLGLSSPSVSAAGGSLWVSCVVTSGESGDPAAGFTSNDNGQTWSPEAVGENGAYNIDVEAVGANAAWGFGNAGPAPNPLFRTTDGGQQWQKVRTIPGEDSVVGFAAASTNVAWYVAEGFGPRGEDFTAYRTDDGGLTWRSTPLPAPANLRGLVRVLSV